MHSFLVKDLKAFTAGLFAGDLFDTFLLVEADFVTNTVFHMDGEIQKNYYDSEDLLPADRFVTWAEKKPLAYQIIKGKRLPLSFKLVFRLSGQNLEKTLAASHTAYTPADVDGFYLNITYKNGKLTMTSGLSMTVFTMDKALQEYWDELAEKFLKQANISFE